MLINLVLHWYICSIKPRERDIHGAQEKDTSDVEFLDEDPKVVKEVWLLH